MFASAFLIFVVDALLTGVFLWLGMKLVAIYQGFGSGVYCTYPQLVMAAAASSLVLLIPGFGIIVSWLVLFLMLKKFTEASFLEILLMVIIAKVATLIFALWFGILS